ncbi:YtxH domain-containing protein [Ornithinimicrobium cavernae]|uniref:YtxH domain-containing protein n=1 Tax=Ornithinimicrobium cavernae TaxID=2666047 RepID=UPI000D69AF93|nr:YtxH domain-containing protein [Ornithinimicrobium cavernae]
MRKLMFIIGAGVGYILGAKAGRERYEQISEQASKVWGNPKVQSTVEDVKAQAPRAASAVAGSAKDIADQARAKVTGHETTGLSGDYENATGSWDSRTGTASVDDSSFGPGGDKLP